MIWRLLLAIVLLVVVVGGIVGFNMFRDQAIQGFFAGMQPPPVTVSVVEARPTSWRPGIEAIGTANAAQGVQLGIEADGIVREILFSANDRVEAGQRLLQIDHRVEQADLAAAQAQLELGEATLERYEGLRARGVVPTADLDVAIADAANARAQLLGVSAVLSQKALEAPFAGVVGIPQIEVGAYVTPGTVYATLQDLDTMRVDFSIPEQQIRQISSGVPDTVSSEIGGTELSGHSVAVEPRIDPNSRLVTLRAEVENSVGELNPGQFLRVRVELPEENGVIALPQTVLSSNLYGDSVFIVRSQGEGDARVQTVEQVFVDAGRRARGLVEIRAGVEPGDQVVSAGQNRLSSGATVMIDNSVQPTTAAAPAAAVLQ
jgi:membrane fusion protein (multidrug efflux system)